MTVRRWVRKKLLYIIVALAVICGLLIPVFSNMGVVIIEGTVQYIYLEGGFWGIIGTDGNNYLPVNLDIKNMINGISVRIKAKILDDMVSTQQWGKPIEIISIEVISEINY